MWFFFALAAAAFWGMSYAFAEKTLQKITIPTYLAIESSATVLLFLVASFFSTFKQDLQMIQADRNLILLLVANAGTFLLANLASIFAIRSSNATWAGLIEICYPLFIILFSWLFFRTQHLNAGILAGGFCILCGVILLYYFGNSSAFAG